LNQNKHQMKTIKEISFNFLNKNIHLSQQGYVMATYSNLVEKLGEPEPGPYGNKIVMCMWILDFNGLDVIIYGLNQKEIPKEIFYWFVDCNDNRCLDYLKNKFNLHSFR
jgi:hypothetical protein